MDTNSDWAEHWQAIYQTSRPTEVSWYEPVPRCSLELIQATGLPLDAPLLDVGAGASRLVDYLLAAGYADVTVLDIAPAALAQAKARLGPEAQRVQWIVGDVTAFQPDRRYALWHDRAVLHFLITSSEREQYLATLTAALIPGGHVVLAAFGPGGPTRCSGLPVQRYSPQDLTALLGPGYRLRQSRLENHCTPAGHARSSCTAGGRPPWTCAIGDGRQRDLGPDDRPRLGPAQQGTLPIHSAGPNLDHRSGAHVGGGEPAQQRPFRTDLAVAARQPQVAVARDGSGHTA